jgi:hypothetical protein
MIARIRCRTLDRLGGVGTVIKIERVAVEVLIVGEPVERARTGNRGEDQGSAQPVLFGRGKNKQTRKRQQKPAIVPRQRRARCEDPGHYQAARTLGLRESNREKQNARLHREEDMLVHRRGLRIQDVGIQRKNHGRAGGRGGASIRLARGSIQHGSRQNKTEDARQRSGPPALPSLHVADERQHQDMRQGQPHGSKLFVSRSAGINGSPRDLKMRFPVVVVEDVPGVMKPDRGECGYNSQHRRDRDVFPDARAFERARFDRAKLTGIRTR